MKMATQRGDHASFATLAQRTDLPPRVYGLLNGLLEKARAHFSTALPQAVGEFENALLQRAERASSNALQQDCLANLREIRLRSTQLTPRFLSHLEATLARIRHATASPADALPPHAPAELQLVDVSVLEEDLALQEIAGKSDIRQSQALHALSHRLGVIAGSPAWTNETLPLGPAQLVEAFRDALAECHLGIEARVLAYREFDRVAMLPVGAFYQTLNAYLIAQRVLPNLQWQAGRPRAGAARATQTQSTLPDERNEAADVQQAPQTPNAIDAELFATLSRLLAEQRRNNADTVPHAPGAAAASRDDLQSVLNMLQRDFGSEAESTITPGTDRFKQELLAELRRSGPRGSPLRLADEDADTIDLVGMLFDHITANMRDGSGARTLLNRLHIPALRAALGDKTFFTRRDHPARELLNTIAETGMSWFDETDADPDLSRKMKIVVDNVGANFDGDLAVFERLLADLGGHMRLLARRAEVAERRHIDAARGRDKLDIARGTARAMITRIIQGGDPTPLIRTLLEKAWTDALALSALRHGAASDEFKRRLGVAIKLARSDVGTAAASDKTLRRELDDGLRQVGLHVDDIAQLNADLFMAPGDTARSGTDSRSGAIDILLKDKIRLGGEVTASSVQREAIPLNQSEKAMLDRVRTIPFGTWFDFIQNQQGASLRRKLAWFSTLTGRCLFVNQRGLRDEDRTLERLARDMVRGQAHIVVAEETSLIDRAWKAILENLRRGGGEANGPTP